MTMNFVQKTKIRNELILDYTHKRFFLSFFFFKFFFFLRFIYYLSKSTVAVFRHSRRGSQISLRMVVSHHVVAGI
jgi:hypothetical protein